MLRTGVVLTNFGRAEEGPILRVSSHITVTVIVEERDSITFEPERGYVDISDTGLGLVTVLTEEEARSYGADYGIAVSS